MTLERPEKVKKIEISKAMRPPLILGWKIDDRNNDNLIKIVKMAESVGISFLVLNLNKIDPEGEEEIPGFSDPDYLGTHEQLRNFIPLGGSDLALPNEIWSQRIVSSIKTNNLKTLKSQLDWSCYVGCRCILVDLETILADEDSQLLTGRVEGSTKLNVLDRLVLFCQIISSSIRHPNMPTIWISLDCCDQSWNTWSMIYELCNFSEKIKVCLKLDPVKTNIEIWQSEPVKSVMLSEGTFVKEADKTLLDTQVAEYLLYLMNNNVKIVFDGNLNYQDMLNSEDKYGVGTENEDTVMEDVEDKLSINEVIKVVKKLYSKLGPLTINELYGRGYEDLLQIQLQPVRDNLDSTTYNEFEKCSYKYESYKLAVKLFVDEMNKAKKGQDKKFYNVYVLGAGRGPLVEVVLEIFKINKIKNYKIVALDKNPFTMVTLNDKLKTSNWKNVELMYKDMRNVTSTKDIFENTTGKDTYLVMSEMLGAFGDNELAPECLYGFERFLNKNYEVHFIPESYTSYVMPIHAPQLWAKIKNFGNVANLHMAYTVHLKSYSPASDKFEKCFHFSHPYKLGEKGDRQEDLERYKVLKFQAKNDCFVHGFAAYFKCKLFNEVGLSILPNDTNNIKSWFPMFFPIEMPFPAKKSQTITLHIWRRSDHLKMWYEWAFTTPATTLIHNVNGFSYNIAKN